MLSASDLLNSRRLKYDDQLKRLLEGLRDSDLSNDIHDMTPCLKAHGSYCDVFKAKSRKHNDIVVAVKRLRVHIFYDKSVSKVIFQELSVWSKLEHPNILSLLGYIMHGEYPALISIWMNKGSLCTYMQDNPNFSKKEMTRGIAAGLAYLHRQSVIHSDLKSENILISDSGEPLLSDFGISRVMTSTSITPSTNIMGSARWMAIEIYTSMCRHTKQTDIWAFGMVTYELLTGLLPFSHLKNDIQASFAIAKGQLPFKPELLEGADELLLWSICEQCWSKKPLARPDIASINERLLGTEYVYDDDSDDSSPVVVHPHPPSARYTEYLGTDTHLDDYDYDGYDFPTGASQVGSEFEPETGSALPVELRCRWDEGISSSSSGWESDSNSETRKFDKSELEFFM